jgi:diaminopimelate decarboxylase
MKKPTKKQKIELAAKALSNLNIFSAIVEMLEGGTISGNTEARISAANIIDECKLAVHEQLEIYDDLVDKI